MPLRGGEGGGGGGVRRLMANNIIIIFYYFPISLYVIFVFCMVFWEILILTNLRGNFHCHPNRRFASKKTVAPLSSEMWLMLSRVSLDFNRPCHVLKSLSSEMWLMLSRVSLDFNRPCHVLKSNQRCKKQYTLHFVKSAFYSVNPFSTLFSANIQHNCQILYCIRPYN